MKLSRLYILRIEQGHRFYAFRDSAGTWDNESAFCTNLIYTIPHMQPIVMDLQTRPSYSDEWHFFFYQCTCITNKPESKHGN